MTVAALGKVKPDKRRLKCPSCGNGLYRMVKDFGRWYGCPKPECKQRPLFVVKAEDRLEAKA